MKRFGKILAFSLALLCLLAACGDTSWAATYGDRSISAGVLMYYLVESYTDAENKVADSNKDVLSQEIDGVPAKEYITSRAWDSVYRYFAIWEKFSEYGLEFTAEDEQLIDEYTAVRWEYLGDQLLKNGISETSFRDVITNSIAGNKLFTHYYSEGGIEPLSVADLKDTFANDYARMLMLRLPYYITNFDNYYDVDALTEISDHAQEYAARLNAGEDFGIIVANYNDWRLEFEAAYNAQNPTAMTGDTGGVQTAMLPVDSAPQILRTYGYPAMAELPDPISEAERKVSLEAHSGTETIIRSDNTQQFKDVKEHVFDMGYYTAEVFNSNYGASYYVLVRLDMLESETRMDELYLEAVSFEKSETFSAMLTSWGKELDVKINNAAKSAYNPQKVTPLDLD